MTASHDALTSAIHKLVDLDPAKLSTFDYGYKGGDAMSELFAVTTDEPGIERHNNLGHLEIARIMQELHGYNLG